MMEQTKDEILASPAQWRVIQWLFHYPNIYLCWSDMLDTSVNFSASWASERARQHMVRTMDDIGEYFGISDAETKTKPRIKPLEGGTPRCCFQTFKALLKEGIICKYGKSYYQLNPNTRKQLEIDELETLVSPTPPNGEGE
jgi:hypothetical protein